VIDDPRIYTTRAAAYQLLGKDHEALQDRKRALKLDLRTPMAVFPYEIPYEMVMSVFEFLEREDLIRCMLTCKLWKNLILGSTELCKVMGLKLPGSSPSPILRNSAQELLDLLDEIHPLERHPSVRKVLRSPAKSKREALGSPAVTKRSEDFFSLI